MFIQLPIVNYKYQLKDLIIKTFVPNKDLFYYFFTEIIQPNNQSIKDKNQMQFGLYDALDVQRFRYYPGTKRIFTFVGFSKPITRENAKLGKVVNKKAYNNKFYNYPYTYKSEDLFTPDENLFDLYFKENRPSVKQIHLKDVNNYYETESIKDMQKGYKMKKEDENYYTFFGFTNAKLRSISMNALKARHDIDLNSIKIFYTQADKEDEISKYEENSENNFKGNDPNDAIENDENKNDSENDDDDFDENDPNDAIENDENKNDSENDDDDFDENDPNDAIENDKNKNDDDDDFDENDPNDASEN